MRQLRIHAHGGPDALVWEDAPEPAAGPGQVRVQVAAVGLNHLDVWVRRGVPGHRFPLPLIPGSDVAGVVEGTGQRVALHPATSCGSCPACQAGRQNLCRRYCIRGEGGDGGLRQVVVCDQADLLPVPDGLTLVQAAALPLSLLTAWHMLDKARLGPGETCLVVGGASGVGWMACQIAALRGARVLATARSPAKARALETLGVTVLDGDGPYHRDVKSQGGADVVFEHVGAATWERSLKALAWGGRLVTCGATTGASVSVDLRTLFFKQQALIGSTMGSRGDMLRAWSQVGRILPHVGLELPWTQIGAAHQALEQHQVVGKVVLRVD